MSKLQLIGDIRSRAFRVKWMLEEIGEPYEHVRAGPHSPDALAWNISGKIPSLVEDGEAVFDSTAIIQYLADSRGRFTHEPGTLERARQDGWTNLLLDEFDACLWAAARHSFVLPEEKRVPGLKPTLRWEFERSSKLLAARMGDGPYLTGAGFTVPDIILGHCALWAEVAKFEFREQKIAAFLEQVRGRPAYQRTLSTR